MDERPQADGEPEEDRAAAWVSFPVAHPEKARHDERERRQRFRHDQGGVGDQPRVKSAQQPGRAGAPWRELVARETMGDDRQERADDGAEDGGYVRSVAEETVGPGQEAAVSDRPMAPRMPSADPIRIAEAGRDAPRAEVVVVAVPHRLARPGDGDV